MRILFITNYYPPSDHGWGYMQLCEEVANGLAARGHDIAVLTSTRLDGSEATRPYPVHRLLTIDPDWHIDQSAAWQFFKGRKQREHKSVTLLEQMIESFRPQVIFIWHAIGLPRVLLHAAEQQPDIVIAYYLAGYLPELPDEYVAYWRIEPARRLTRLIKRPISRLALTMLRREGKPILLKYEHVICVSDYVRQRLLGQGLIPQDTVVIHNGVDINHFVSKRSVRLFEGCVELLCAGRLEPDKGVHDVIEALGLLNPEQRTSIARLDIVGDGQPAYVTYLRVLVEKYDLTEIVRFLPPVSRDDMPALLDSYDVLVQPSALEALSRMVQEAMAVGLLVIGTTTGGSGELLVHRQTGLAFEAGNACSLAEQLKQVISDPYMMRRLAAAGQTRVRSEFSIDRTISEIENYLRLLVEAQK